MTFLYSLYCLLKMKINYKELNELKKRGILKSKYPIREYYAFKRGLKFKPLNEVSEENNIAHHINDTYVIFIPKLIHQLSIRRNLNDHRKLIKTWLFETNLVLWYKVITHENLKD